jgi:hypothetical protein
MTPTLATDEGGLVLAGAFRLGQATPSSSGRTILPRSLLAGLIALGFRQGPATRGSLPAPAQLEGVN